MADASVEAKIRALYLGACDSGASEEEARSKAVAMVRLAQKHGLSLFVPQEVNPNASALTEDEVIGLINDERERGQRALAMLRRAHAEELSRLRVGRVNAPAPREPMLVAEVGMLRSWREVALFLMKEKRGTIVLVPFSSLGHPVTEGGSMMLDGASQAWLFPVNARGVGMRAVRGEREWRAYLINERLARESAY